MKIQIRNDQQGMTLVEILIAMGISIMVALGVATIFQVATRMENDVKVKQEAFLSDQEWEYGFKVAPPPKPN